MKSNWCEHLDKTCRYLTLKYNFDSGEVVLRVQTWVCPECGVHGAETEIIPPPRKEKSAAV